MTLKTPKPLALPTYPVVVTDLDGTLLDHHTYGYAPALPALHQIEKLAIPLVFCSSKTAAELIPLRAEMGNDHPYIVENGAAICGVKHDHGASHSSRECTGRIQLGVPYHKILDILHPCRQQNGYRFTGFADMSVGEVAGVTGLSVEQAGLAKQREYSEPIIWQDTDARRQQFLQQIELAGLTAQEGGRFLSIAGASNKGRAVAWLRNYYVRHTGLPVAIIALGDSPNDQSMLAAADTAVVIHSKKSGQIQLAGPRKIIVTEESGPTGWNRAMTTLLETYQHG